MHIILGFEPLRTMTLEIKPMMPGLDALPSAVINDQSGYMLKNSHLFVQVIESSFVNGDIWVVYYYMLFAYNLKDNYCCLLHYVTKIYGKRIVSHLSVTYNWVVETGLT